MALARGLVDHINRAARRVPPWLIYLAGFGWSAWLLWEAASGALGADPVKGLERGLGKLGLQILVAVLCISPLRRHLGVNLIRFRRALGLTAFYYIAMHFVAWIVLDMGLLILQALGDIVKRPYVTIGMAGLVLMIPLALTSNDRMVRRLGAARWQRLQRLTYPAILLGSVHYIWQVKAWPLEPFLYLVAILALLALRFPAAPRRAAA
ncbi:MAG: protein-methionine-sulfoxide reductase heme-binding subunit MsrQ [Proteobacteria bacterium]|nr:protein-methionine-sulfoxide reductase heme-binding subunit MsrQ [Pseudomonadota bacterium]MBS0572933.1 protein-methionine-sulfoxide reductase heme-binding subunit MsrQ [Pseudomonadota bacterium]